MDFAFHSRVSLHHSYLGSPAVFWQKSLDQLSPTPPMTATGARLAIGGGEAGEGKDACLATEWKGGADAVDAKVGGLLDKEGMKKLAAWQLNGREAAKTKW